MELLQHLALRLGFDYISDLRYRSIPRSGEKVIRELSETDYSLHDYNECAQYILDTKQQFSTIQDAKAAILERLRP